MPPNHPKPARVKRQKHDARAERTPAHLLAILVVSIFAVETAIMVALPLLSPLPRFAAVLIDSVSLTLLLFPVLYFLVFSPLTTALAQYDLARRELQNQVEKLQRFQEAAIGRELRMNELFEENQALKARMGERAAAQTRAALPADAAQAVRERRGDDAERDALLFMLEDLQRSRQQIKAAHQEWLTALDSIDDLVFMHDKDFRIMRANRAYAMTAGVPVKEVLGKVYWEIFPKRADALPHCRRAEQGVVEENHIPAEESNEIQLGGGRVFQSRSFAIKEGDGGYRYSLHILEDVTERKRAEAKIRETMELVRNGLEDTVQAVLTMIEVRDPYTAGHQKRVADLAVAIARSMGLPDDEVHGIRLASVIHDTGKIRVPAEILSNPGVLNAAEMAIVKYHPQIGHDLLKDIKFPWPIADMIWQHHEWLDGSGYPRGLKGEEILPGARILTVADVVEAMASFRPYRPGMGLPLALAEIRQYRGKRYDPEVVDACLKLFEKSEYQPPEFWLPH